MNCMNKTTCSKSLETKAIQTLSSPIEKDI
jgi:hypothetical protein